MDLNLGFLGNLNLPTFGAPAAPTAPSLTPPPVPTMQPFSSPTLPQLPQLGAMGSLPTPTLTTEHQSEKPRSSVVDSLAAQASTPIQAGSQGGALSALSTLTQVAMLRQASQPHLAGSSQFQQITGNLPSTATPALQRFMSIARSKLGDPYVFATEGPTTFDCSGLVSFALQHSGINVPRMSAAGYQQLFSKDSIQSRSQLQPGDLMFYYYPNSRGIGAGNASHIDIYLGNGHSIGASGSSVHVGPVDWSAWLGGAAVPGLFR